MKRRWFSQSNNNNTITPEQHMAKACELNAILSGYSAIDIEIAHGHIDNALLLLKGENPIYNQHGFTPLHTAVYNGNLEIILKIIRIAPQMVTLVDKNGASPLHWAAMAGCFYAVNYLINAGANLHQQDNNRKTAYEIAVALGGDLDTLRGPVNEYQKVQQALFAADVDQRMNAHGHMDLPAAAQTFLPSQTNNSVQENDEMALDTRECNRSVKRFIRETNAGR